MLTVERGDMLIVIALLVGEIEMKKHPKQNHRGRTVPLFGLNWTFPMRMRYPTSVVQWL